VLRLAFFFGLFQTLMPLMGWALTTHFSHYLEAVDHWIAFGMLAFIGGKMVIDSFKPEDEPHLNPRDGKTQLALAFATSIDALAVGITYACTGYNTLGSISLPLGIIGLVSFLMSLLGFKLGVRFGEVVIKKMRPELLGGIILIGIGVRILIEHLCA
jgi:putative Mn2+ efflux pump MntP